MNKYQEIRNRPRYSYKSQLYANDWPSWAKARDDKHSNYQTVLTDLSSVILEAGNSVTIAKGKQFILPYDCFDTDLYYNFFSSNLEYNQKETYREFIKPTSVIANASFLSEPLSLYPVQTLTLEDLANRLPLTIKSEEEDVPPISIIEDNFNVAWPNKKVFFTVNRRCYLSFCLVPKESLPPGTELFNPEDFYYMERNKNGGISIFTRSFVYLKKSDGSDIESMSILNLETADFTYPLIPGQYYLDFDLLKENQLDNFTIQLYANQAFGIDKKVNIGPIIVTKDAFAVATYYRVSGEYLELVSKETVTDAGEEIQDNFMLLHYVDEDNLEPIALESWAKKENILFGKVGNKLYLYDTFFEGSDYIYQNNDRYAFDLVCDQFNFKVDDEIYVETRLTSYPSYSDLTALRLRVNNKESGEEYFVNAYGDTQATPWREFNINNTTIDDISMLKWKVSLPYIGSYKFTLEGIIGDDSVTLAERIILVNYKIPFKVFTLSEDYEDYLLGVNPDGELELHDPDTGNIVLVKFWKDGYFFNEETGEIWTNTPFDSLTIGYGA